MAASSSSTPPAFPSATELLPSLRSHNTTFLTLLNLIPPKYYLDPSSSSLDEFDDSTLGLNTKFMKNKRKKEGASEDKKLLEKEKKRAKLDPENLKNVSQVVEERRVAAAEKKALEEEDDDEEDDDEDEENGKDIVDSDDEDISMEPSTSTSTANAALPTQNVQSQQDSITTLRERLQTKIAALQNRRRVPTMTGSNALAMGEAAAADDSLDAADDDEDGNSSIASTRDELLEERRRRGEVRDNRRRARKELRRQAAANSSSMNKDSSKKGAASSSSSRPKGSTAPALLVNEGSSYKGKDGRNNGLNGSSSDVAFSSLEFAKDPTSDKKRRDKHALPSNPKQALEMLQARKAKQAEREGEAGPSSSKGDDSDRWNKVEAAARGIKIRDDEKLLRKAIKKKDKEKEKSGVEWKEREKDIKDKEAAKQKKRTENLANRTAASKKGGGKKTGGAIGGGKKTKDRKFGGGGDKKGGGKSGGGASRAGFEGKRMGGGKSSGSGGRGGKSGGRK